MKNTKPYPPTDPASYQVLGWMIEKDYLNLKESIRDSGQVVVPIVTTFEGEIIDGHHRQLAVEELRSEGVKIKVPDAVLLHLTETEEKREEALRLNLQRRNLSRKQKHEIVQNELKYDPSRNDTWIGNICGVDPKTVGSHRSKLEREKEIRHFDEYRTRNGKTYPRTIARDSREAKKLRKDASAVYGDLPEGSFRKINVEQIQRDVNREAVKKMELPSDNLTDDIEMLACDFREMEVEDESINAILTDPLYEGDALHLWSDLAEFAEKKLVDGGLLVAYTGIEFLPEVLERLTGELDYIWQRVVFFKGNKRSNCGPIRGGSGYRPILIFGKNRKQLEKGILDVIPSGDREKEWHPFQQSVSEAEHILNDMTSQGDLICDPFAGSFTTAIACHRTGRRFIGCDLDKDNLKVGKYRLLAEKGEVDPSNLPFPSKNEAVS